MVRGDHELNEAKLMRAVGARVKMADADTVQRITEAPVGFAGPIGLKEKGVLMLADYDIAFFERFRHRRQRNGRSLRQCQLGARFCH
jgi:prolyl-tRNA synthetase